VTSFRRRNILAALLNKNTGYKYTVKSGVQAENEDQFLNLYIVYICHIFKHNKIIHTKLT